MVDPVSVGPTGEVAFAETLKLRLALVVTFAEVVDPALTGIVAFPVTGAEWVWMTVVPFSVQSDVNVV